MQRALFAKRQGNCRGSLSLFMPLACAAVVLDLKGSFTWTLHWNDDGSCRCLHGS
jgi:hypothetical protein